MYPDKRKRKSSIFCPTSYAINLQQKQYYFFGEMGNIFKICSSLWLWLRQNAIQNYCPYNDANWFLPKLSPNIQLLEISKSENLSHFSKDLASEGNWLAQSFWANWSGLAQGKFDISKTWILMSKTVVLCLTSCLGHWNLLDSWAWHQAKPDELTHTYYF